MANEVFNKRAQNVVSLVKSEGDAATTKVAAVLQDVHQAAVETVAERVQRMANSAFRDGHDDRGRLLASLMHEIRLCKSGNQNL